MQWRTQVDKITTNIRVKIDFTLPELSAIKTMTCNWHMDESSKGIHDNIFGRYLLTTLGLNINFSDHVTEVDNGTFKGSTAPMVYLGMYEFTYFKTGNITPA